MILYFSGTGNSRYVANKIAKKIQEEKIIDLAKFVKANEDLQVENEEKLIFVYPTYAGRLPRFLAKYLSKQRYKENAKAFFVTTCGASGGNQSQNLKSFCETLGLCFMNFFSVKMPENYIALFSVPSKEKASEIIKKAEPIINAISSKIAEDTAVTHVSGFTKSPYNKLFYKLFVSAKGFYVEETCVGCGKCADSCVLNNIELVADRPQWGEVCTHCMACISCCPTKAIQYKNSTQTKNRYWLKEEENEE